MTHSTQRWKYFFLIGSQATPLYIHSELNHLPSIIKQLPSMINKRISNLSCNEHEFNKAKPLSETALKSSGFNYSMKFETHVENARRNRSIKTLKVNGTDHHLRWGIKSYASQYKCSTRRCDLCLTEKMIVALADQKVLLNKRAVLISKYRHRSKFILNSVE